MDKRKIKVLLVFSLVAFFSVSTPSTILVAQENEEEFFEEEDEAVEASESAETEETEDLEESADADGEESEEIETKAEAPSKDQAAPPAGSEDDAEDVSFEEFDDEGGEETKESVTEGEGLEPLEAGEEPLEEEIVEETPIEPEPVVQPEPAPVEEPMAEPQPVESYAATPDVSDEPDLAYESRLYDIYINFHSQKTSAEQWDALLGGRQAESYVIQSGDTLWGISQTIFGDGNYWPKIWSLNGRITNPHLITPGFTIRFLLGDESDAPAFTVTESDAPAVQQELAMNSTVSTVGSTQPSYLETTTGEVEIPPPSVISRPTVMKLPPSLPAWTDQDRGGTYDDLGIDYGKRPILSVKDSIAMSAYVTEEVPEGIGKVEEVESGGYSANLFQYVYVAMAEGKGRSGEEYLVIRNLGRIRRANSEVEGPYGYGIEVQGQVKLLDPIKSSADGQVFRALVVRSLAGVKEGSVLTNGKVQNIVLSDKGPRSQVVAQIVGGQFDESRQLFGPQNIAFLNRGSVDGLAAGQVLPVRSNRKVRNPDTMIEENVIPIGYIQIVRVEPTVATAVVLKTWGEIYPGDLTGQGAFISKTPEEMRGRQKIREEVEFDFSDETADSDANEEKSPFDDSQRKAEGLKPDPQSTPSEDGMEDLPDEEDLDESELFDGEDEDLEEL